MALFVAAILFALAASPALAEGLRPRTCIARALPNETPAALFEASGRFDCATKQSEFGPGDYWARLSGFSAAPVQGDRLVLRLVSMWQDKADVFIRYADGRIARQSYSAQDAGKYLTIGAVFEVPIPWREVPVTQVLIRVHKSANVRGIVLGAAIATATQSADIKSRWMALYAVFAGIAITLIVYNLALWRAMRQRFQLYYCAMVAAMGLYALSTSGWMIHLIPGLDNITRMKAGYGLLACAAVAALYFVRDFFEPEVIGRRLRQAAMASGAALLMASLLFVLFAEWNATLLSRCYYAAYIPGAVVIDLIFIRAFLRKSPLVGIMVLAWFPPMITGALRWAHGVDLLPYNFWLDHSTLIGFGIEAMISSTAISIRIRNLARELDHARTEESIARELARIDPLTGLLNRRGFLDSALGSAGLRHLILLDIDHFKQVNDRFGHDTGDEVLRSIALIVRKWAPEGACVARIGGEEFAILADMPAGASMAATALLARVRATSQPTGRPVTASIGIAQGPLSTEQDWRNLYREADAALYRAKADGRDRVSIATRFARAA